MYDEIEEMLPLNNAELNDYKNAMTWKLCECQFTDTNIKVYRHDHLSGKYIAPLCKSYNLKF